MERRNAYSIIIMVIMVIGIVLTYNSWELWRGWLIVWAMILTLEVLVLGAYIGNFIKENLL
jgi:hypothetical protein